MMIILLISILLELPSIINTINSPELVNYKQNQQVILSESNIKKTEVLLQNKQAAILQTRNNTQCDAIKYNLPP
jgi:hypothetical protein